MSEPSTFRIFSKYKSRIHLHAKKIDDNYREKNKLVKKISDLKNESNLFKYIDKKYYTLILQEIEIYTQDLQKLECNNNKTLNKFYKNRIGFEFALAYINPQFWNFEL